MIRLGIIGMSAGNAHPYSWSSIINGHFDGEEIRRIGYPAVASYLEANRDTLGIPGAEVVCVLTQDREISASIAKSSRIAHIVDTPEEMIPLVDAVLLSRDDPENHVAMAKPFIEAGIPLYVDKPLASSKEDLRYFEEQVSKGKFIMSCSSMRFANEGRIVRQEIDELGKIELATTVGKKDWIKYGVHMLEAMFAVLDDPKPLYVQSVGEKDREIVVIDFDNGTKATVHLFMDICGTFQVSLFGQKGWRMFDIKNSYSQFRETIIEFLRSVDEGHPRLPFYKTRNIIQTVIAAIESREQGGVKINMSEF